MGVSTTHRINLSMWILIYSFSDTLTTSGPPVIIPEDINLEISILQDNKADGLYSSPVRLLKLAKRVISAPLATIFNQSICSGIFPSKLKCAKIFPIFKDEDDTLPENYRPISLLSIYNRTFEKLMYTRVTKFVKDCNILYDQQYGFRSKHSPLLDLWYLWLGKLCLDISKKDCNSTKTGLTSHLLQ